MHEGIVEKVKKGKYSEINKTSPYKTIMKSYVVSENKILPKVRSKKQLLHKTYFGK